MQRGVCTIDTFDDFKRELKSQFFPVNAEEEAKGRLRRLKQMGSIRDYVKEFTTLLLEVPDTSDKDALFLFMDGLQSWAKLELKRRGVQDLATAIAVAESLIDYSTNKEGSMDKEEKFGGGKSGGDHAQVQGNTSHREAASFKSRDKGKERGERDSSKPRVKCFICDGPHWARECPKRKALSALVASEHDQAGVEDDEGARMGSL